METPRLEPKKVGVAQRKLESAVHDLGRLSELPTNSALDLVDI